MSDYKIMFSDQGDLIYIDTNGALMYREGGGEEQTICSSGNTEALVEFLKEEMWRRKMAKKNAEEGP